MSGWHIEEADDGEGNTATLLWWGEVFIGMSDPGNADEAAALRTLVADAAEAESLRRRAALAERLTKAILDIDAHATPFGDIPDDPGWVGVYLLSAGSLHRALGIIGHSAGRCTDLECDRSVKLRIEALVTSEYLRAELEPIALHLGIDLDALHEEGLCEDGTIRSVPTFKLSMVIREALGIVPTFRELTPSAEDQERFKVALAAVADSERRAAARAQSIIVSGLTAVGVEADPPAAGSLSEGPQTSQETT